MRGTEVRKFNDFNMLDKLERIGKDGENVYVEVVKINDPR
jgi:hypothetical protein